MKGMKHGVEICTFTEQETDALCDVIRKENMRYVYTGHCTGQAAFGRLQQRLGDIIRPLTTGMRFTL